jgi:hypothetical protein
MSIKPSKSKVVKVRADSLAVHPFAQRDLVPSKLKKLEADLDLDAIGVLHAVEYPIHRETKIWIIDGQHRLQALLTHGFGEWLVEVKVHLDVVDDARASALFLKLNDRSPVSSYDRWVNEIKAKNGDAINTNAIVMKHNLTVERQSGDSHVTCVSSLKKLYLVDSGASLDKTLGAIVAAWGSKAAALEGRLIDGIGQVFARYNGSIDEPAMVKKLAKYSGGAPGLVGDARGLMEYRRMTLSRCIAERVIDTYNLGRRVGKLDPM